MPIMPTDIVEDVRTVLQDARRGKGGERPNFLTAYQILDRLPARLRDQLIEERGLGGQGTGVVYAAPSVVSDAAELVPGRVIEYMDSVGITVEIAGQRRTPSGPVTGLYRVD